MRTAIVLAGGLSTRFGADKLAADLGAASMLATTISTLSGVADRVVVAGRELRPGEGTSDPQMVEVVPDAEPFGGPLLALANLLERVEAGRDDLAIIVGGDMPLVVPDVLRAMLDRLAAEPSAAAVLLERAQTEPRRQVLPLAVRIDAARIATHAVLDAGERSLQALVDRLTVGELPESVWRALDPEARTVLDVDTPADLDRVRAGYGR